MSEETEIRTIIEDWARAVRARDIDAVLANHTPDIQMFDVPPPVTVEGIDAYRDTWPAFFEWQREHDGSFDIASLRVTAGIDVAFATAVLLCASRDERERDDMPRLRLSIGLRKEGGRWQIAHEHHSYPLDAQGASPT